MPRGIIKSGTAQTRILKGYANLYTPPKGGMTTYCIFHTTYSGMHRLCTLFYSFNDKGTDKQHPHALGGRRGLPHDIVPSGQCILLGGV